MAGGGGGGQAEACLQDEVKGVFKDLNALKLDASANLKAWLVHWVPQTPPALLRYTRFRVQGLELKFADISMCCTAQGWGLWSGS